ncbi:IS3 family transposase [Burkholderia sp. Ax-1735]|nr:IS3 family transposase [Burkholderia sp. Ap-955]NIF08262.1 IS3 family transposase [Burkholderia sp. Ax-1735]NIG01101.1 IS3 family transposase [Burkholderia sp. Tr-849]
MDDLRDERRDARVVAGNEVPLADDRYAGAVLPLKAECVMSFQGAALKALVTSVRYERHGVVGVRKVWHPLLCDGVKVARCTVGRLMKATGVESVRRGRRIEIAWRLTGCRIRLPPSHFLPPRAASIFSA